MGDARRHGLHQRGRRQVGPLRQRAPVGRGADPDDGGRRIGEAAARHPAGVGRNPIASSADAAPAILERIGSIADRFPGPGRIRRATPWMLTCLGRRPGSDHRAEGTLGIVTEIEWRLDQCPRSCRPPRLRARLDSLGRRGRCPSLSSHPPWNCWIGPSSTCSLATPLAELAFASARPRRCCWSSWSETIPVRCGRRSAAPPARARPSPMRWTPPSPGGGGAALGHPARRQPHPGGASREAPLAPGDRGRLRAGRADGRVHPLCPAGGRRAGSPGGHVRPCRRRAPPREPAARAGRAGLGAAVAGLLQEVTDAVVRLGGTPSGEHGEGGSGPDAPGSLRSRGRRAVPPGQGSFDPLGIFNPGIILPSGEPPISRLKVG